MPGAAGPVPAHRTRPGTRSDRGQTSVEFLGLLPLIILVLAVLWECVLAGYAYTLAGDAADRGAHRGAVSGDDGACRAAALASLPDAWQSGPDINCGNNGPDLYRATVRLEVPVLFPGLAGFPVRVRGEASAARER